MALVDSLRAASSATRRTTAALVEGRRQVRRVAHRRATFVLVNLQGVGVFIEESAARIVLDEIRRALPPGPRDPRLDTFRFRATGGFDRAPGR